MFLNIWGAQLYEELRRYIQQMSRRVDIFCLTEIHSLTSDGSGEKPIIWRRDKGAYCVNFFETLQETLTDTHTGFFSAERKHALHDVLDIDAPVSVGSAVFYRNSLDVTARSVDFVNGCYQVDAPDGSRSRVMQSVCLSYHDAMYLISHFHGLWRPEGKVDTPSRLEQSKRAVKVLATLKQAHNAQHVILGGDFNYHPDNEALQILKSASAFGRSGASDLIDEYRVTSTRTKQYRHYNVNGHTLYADWVFISPEINVKGFSVPTKPVVSDHRPIILRI